MKAAILFLLFAVVISSGQARGIPASPQGNKAILSRILILLIREKAAESMREDHNARLQVGARRKQQELEELQDCLRTWQDAVKEHDEQEQPDDDHNGSDHFAKALPSVPVPREQPKTHILGK
jgi:hypothetical protein